MRVKITGVGEILKNLEAKLGTEKTICFVNKTFEFGFTKKGKRIEPQDFGTVQKIYESSKDEFKKSIKQGLEELIK